MSLQKCLTEAAVHVRLIGTDKGREEMDFQVRPDFLRLRTRELSLFPGGGGPDGRYRLRFYLNKNNSRNSCGLSNMEQLVFIFTYRRCLRLLPRRAIANVVGIMHG